MCYEQYIMIYGLKNVIEMVVFGLRCHKLIFNLIWISFFQDSL